MTDPANDFKTLTHFAGHDWAKDHHDLVVVDRAGQVVLDLRIDNTAEGWHRLRTELQAFAHPAVAIETSSGAAVERLLEAGLTVYPVNPKATRYYRQRKAPSGTKTDRLEAWALADALRTDGHAWRPLASEDPALQELRLLCRDEIGLIEQRTALVNQLQQALYEYYPVILEAFDDWTKPFTWAFVMAFPTPERLVGAGKRKWEKFLHTHKLYRSDTAQKRLACFARAAEFRGSDPVTNAKGRLAVATVRQLQVLQTQLDEYRQRIEELFNQTRAMINFLEAETRVYPHRIAFNCLPHIDKFLDNGYTKEEMKMVNETRKILEDPSIGVTATTVRVPVFFGHSEAVNVETRRACSADEVRALLAAAPGIKVVDDPAHSRYPLAIDAAGQDLTLVGRIRQDESIPNGINMWIAADNIRKGAATNAVQIAQILGEHYL